MNSNWHSVDSTHEVGNLGTAATAVEVETHRDNAGIQASSGTPRIGPYVVEPSDEKDASTNQPLDAWKISGPDFPGFVRFGAGGKVGLETLAARMNLAFAAGVSSK